MERIKISLELLLFPLALNLGMIIQVLHSSSRAVHGLQNQGLSASRYCKHPSHHRPSYREKAEPEPDLIKKEKKRKEKRSKRRPENKSCMQQRYAYRGAAHISQALKLHCNLTSRHHWIIDFVSRVHSTLPVSSSSRLFSAVLCWIDSEPIGLWMHPNYRCERA